ncbi:MAG TPA: metallophosphoesterase [Chloroflexota bacterium]|nr:metallophosphoesterase [Chloroflexota bacterium]
MKRIAIALALVSLLLWLPPAGSRVTAAGGSADRPLTVMAGGDIACDPLSPFFHAGEGDARNCQEKATSDLVMQAHPDAVLALGDNQYEVGALEAFGQSYGTTWGRFKNITYPVLGNHEYLTPGAAGYFAYYGKLARNPQGGYYSFNLGDWHFIALNSECNEPGVGGCGLGSPQESWLLSDLAANRQPCTLAFWHEPRFTSGRNLNHPALQTWWEDLYAFGAAIVLNGHDHIYERFAPQDPSQKADRFGIREFIVGTGGNNHQPAYGVIQPNSVVRDNTTYGVLQLTLRAGSYDWQYLPAHHTGNGKFTDKGSGTCPGADPQTTSTVQPRAVAVVTSNGVGAVARFTVNFASQGVGQGYVRFGSGPGCSGLVMTALGDQGVGTTNHWLVVTGNDLPGTVGDNGVMPGSTYWYETVTRTRAGEEVNDNGGKCYSVTIPAVAAGH